MAKGSSNKKTVDVIYRREGDKDEWQINLGLNSVCVRTKLVYDKSGKLFREISVHLAGKKIVRFRA